jgi:hypothetical protein
MTEKNLSGIYSLLDVLRMKDPGNDRLLFVADTLGRKSPIIREAPMMEANQALSHVGSRDSQLPTVQKRAINDGVPKSAHREIPITAPMALYETMSQVDEELLKLQGGNAAAFRQRKDAKFIEAMAQSMDSDTIYGSLASDELAYNGFFTQFNDLSAYPNGDTSWMPNVWDGSGTGSDLSSILVVEWGPEKTHLIYPKNTMGGIEIVDLGKQLVSGITANTEFVAFVTQFKWRAGLFVADERTVQRVSNIETTGTSNTFDDDQLLEAINWLPDMGENPMTRIYVNRTIRTQMDKRLKDKNNVNYTAHDAPFGPPVLKFRGVPVQVDEQMLKTEDAVT